MSAAWLAIMLLRLFHKCGHKPIVLMGGGTTRIGDPSGKDEARQLLDDAQIARNMAGYPHGLRQIHRNSATDPATP